MRTACNLPRLIRRLKIYLLACVALGACGGDDPKPASPEDQVRTAATRVATSKDAEAVCIKFVTERFIEEVYEGDRQACIDSPFNDADEEDPGKPKVGRVTVNGTSADVRVGIVGGRGDGTEGTLLFAREGGRWKLDRFGADYLRSAFVTAIEATDEGVLSIDPMKRCLTRQATRMREAPLRRFIYQTARDDPKVQQTALGFAKRCPKALAAYVASEIGDALAKQGKSPAYVRCMKRELAFVLEVTGLATEALKGNDDSLGTAALGGLVTGADKNCTGR